jgi:hypothetical protein
MESIHFPVKRTADVWDPLFIFFHPFPSHFYFPIFPPVYFFPKEHESSLAPAIPWRFPAGSPSPAIYRRACFHLHLSDVARASHPCAHPDCPAHELGAAPPPRLWPPPRSGYFLQALVAVSPARDPVRFTAGCIPPAGEPLECGDLDGGRSEREGMRRVVPGKKKVGSQWGGWAGANERQPGVRRWSSAPGTKRDGPVVVDASGESPWMFRFRLSPRMIGSNFLFFFRVRAGSDLRGSLVASI